MNLVKLRLSEIHRESFGLESECATFWESFWNVFSTINDDIGRNLGELENGIYLFIIIYNSFLDIQLSKSILQNQTLELRKTLAHEISCTLEQEFSSQRIIERIFDFFEKKFLYDPSHMPRTWSSLDEVDLYFNKSKLEATERLEELVMIYECPVWMNDSNLNEIFCNGQFFINSSEASVTTIAKSLNKNFQRCYLEAKRSVISAQTRIPPWIFLLLLVLGWNEIRAIFTSPFYFLLTLVCILCFALVKFLNLMPYLQVGFEMLLRYKTRIISSLIADHKHAKNE